MPDTAKRNQRNHQSRQQEGQQQKIPGALTQHPMVDGALVLTLFIVLGLVLSNIKVKEKLRLDARKLLIAIMATTIIGGIIIAGLYRTYI